MENMLKVLRNINGELQKKYSPFKHKYPIIINSIPKSGTNLLLNIIKSIPYTKHEGGFSYSPYYECLHERMSYIKSKTLNASPGSIFTGHAPYFNQLVSFIETNSFKHLFIYRDPREYCVSLSHYIMKDKQPRHKFYKIWSNLGNDHNRLLHAITGYGEGKSGYKYSDNSLAGVGHVYQGNLKWLDDPNTLCISFEEIINAKNDENSIIELMDKLLFYLFDSNSFSRLKKINIFQKGTDPKSSHTFRLGKTNSWQDEFTREHKQVFRSVFSDDLLNKYGYSQP